MDIQRFPTLTFSKGRTLISKEEVDTIRSTVVFDHIAESSRVEQQAVNMAGCLVWKNRNNSGFMITVLRISFRTYLESREVASLGAVARE
jgi:hypothetical protein